MLPDRQTARRIISHLKAGTTPLDCVAYLNIGNEKWYEAASQQFDEIATDGDSLVRFIKGYYGDGKTHFMGMLRSIAFEKGWLSAYVTAETTPLHKFDVVYSDVVKNLVLPPRLQLQPWLAHAPLKGADALLAAVFSAFYREAYRSNDRAGLHKERVVEALRAKASQLAVDPYLHELVGTAMKTYVDAQIANDYELAHAVCDWLEGGSSRLPAVKLTRRIDQKIARDILRSLSILVKRAGGEGVLILLDEAERILAQSRTVRAKAYGVLRDLLDNADDQGGMRSSIIYVAATPETFESERGFPEYDALRSRLETLLQFGIDGFLDWRGVVVDLTRLQLPKTQMEFLVRRIGEVHAIARDWSPREHLSADTIKRMTTFVLSRPFGISNLRAVATLSATVLDLLEQNRETRIDDVLNGAFAATQAQLARAVEQGVWD